jgi:hypothetical protein
MPRNACRVETYGSDASKTVATMNRRHGRQTSSANRQLTIASTYAKRLKYTLRVPQYFYRIQPRIISAALPGDGLLLLQSQCEHQQAWQAEFLLIVDQASLTETIDIPGSLVSHGATAK